MILRLSAITFCVLCVLAAQAQFWFGPKGGATRNDFIYQSEAYADTFLVEPSYSFEVGGVLIYQANDMFSVQTELFYERTKRSLESTELSDVAVTSNTANSFLSVPALFRVSFNRGPTHYYVSGGPKVRMWLGGSGRISTDSNDEFVEGDNVWTRLVFNDKNSNTVNEIYAVPDANRVQYALVIGGGVYFDLYVGGRMLLDFKYAFGHSNMGFNNNPDFQLRDYTENFRYRSNTLSISLAYLFEYDVQGARKGMSTIKASNKKKR